MGPAIELHALLRQAERLLAQGDGEGAMADLQQAVADYPTASLAWRRMAETLGVLGMIEEGCFAWMQAIALAPDDPIPLRGLAQTLHDLRDFAQAYPLWQQADQLEANEVRTLFHIGQCLENLQRPQEALAVVGRAHALAPLDPRPLNLLGQIEWRQGRWREAEHWLRQALALAPENAEYLTNLGVVLEALDGLDEAIELHRTAIRLAPQSLLARQNLAQALRYAGDLEGAIAVLREALALAPADANLLWSLGSLQLLKGDDEPGWRGYEARFGRNDPSRLLVDPGPGRWSGPGEAGVDPPRPLDTLVLIGEQGLGDMVQFARYAPLMHRFAERVELCVPPSLIGLIGAAKLADAVRTPQQIQEHPPQAWLPLLSVPGLLGVASGNPLVQGPYLQVDRQRQHLWQQRLEHPNERLIGINWQGKPRTEMQGAFRGRSLPLEAFAPIAELPGIRLVSLQKGAGLEQLQICSFADRFVAAQEQIDACLDFADMAAVMACCDLIISSDTVVPHLAGALGLPVWLLVPAWPDWRWGTQGESSPWYPTLKLFRQQRFGDWQAPMRAIQVALCRDFAIPCPAAGAITEPSAASGFHATAGEQAGDDGGEEAAESSHEELRQQALALVAASEHRAALPLWRQLRHRQPQDLATLVSLAQCLHQLDQHQQARTLSEQAHGLD
ncbi:MAG: tetratricopeptide repeat protein, partial [Synechococcaceae cyanobacterium ELA182]